MVLYRLLKVGVVWKSAEIWLAEFMAFSEGDYRHWEAFGKRNNVCEEKMNISTSLLILGKQISQTLVA